MQEFILDLRLFADSFHQFDLLGTQMIENRLHFGCFHSRLEIIQQRIIQMIVRLEEIRILPAKLDDFSR